MWKGLYSSTILQAHMSIHTEERAISCKVCAENFPNPIRVKNHVHSNVIFYSVLQTLRFLLFLFQHFGVLFST